MSYSNCSICIKTKSKSRDIAKGYAEKIRVLLSESFEIEG